MSSSAKILLSVVLVGGIATGAYFLIKKLNGYAVKHDLSDIKTTATTKQNRQIQFTNNN